MTQPFFHLVCPDCEFDCVIAAAKSGMGLCCPICAGDNGRDVYLRSSADGVIPDTVEGCDDRRPSTEAPL